jgi:hypothetical protein
LFIKGDPVGCANDFNWLGDWLEGSGLDYFRITPIAAVPSVSDIRIVQVLNFDNWKWKVNARVSRKSRALYHALSTIEPIPTRPSIASGAAHASDNAKMSGGPIEVSPLFKIPKKRLALSALCPSQRVVAVPSRFKNRA